MSSESDSPPSIIDTIERQAEESNLDNLDRIHASLLNEYSYGFTDAELEEAIQVWDYWDMERAASLGRELLDERS